MGDRSRLNRAGRRALERQERRSSKGRKIALTGGVALTLGGSLVATTPAQAQTFTVNSPSDDPTVEDDEGVTTLREAIEQANDAAGPDVIVFEAELSGTTIQLEQGQLVVTDDVTINPPPRVELTVNAETGYRVFYLAGEYDDPIDVTIGGISITNGQALGAEGQPIEDGGNILALDTNLTLVDVTVSGGTAASDGGGIAFFADSDYNAGLNIVDSTVTGNASEAQGQYLYYSGGGGIFASGAAQVVITNSAITNNETTFTGDGGGVFLYDIGEADTVITGSTFTGNVAGAAAGGYYPGGSYPDPTVPYNARGGAIYVADDLTLTDTTVAFNTAADDGGGIVVENNDTTITDSSISGNVAQQGSGGGVELDDDAVAITDSYVLNNSAADDGGGIYVDQGYDDTDTLTIAGTTVSGNTAGLQGGGVSSQDSGGVTVVNSAITNNESGLGDGDGGGGGIHVEDLSGPLTVENSTVSGNTAGGGDGGGLNLDDADGPYAFYETNAPVLITDSTFANNRAEANGGGISLYDIEGDVTIERTSITGNDAKYGGGGDDGAGGGIAISGVSMLSGEGADRAAATVSIVDSDISANDAKYGGGAAIGNVAGNVEVENTTVTGNEANFLGGGLIVGGINAPNGTTDASVTITDSIFSSNTTKYAVGGVGIDDVEGDVLITGTTISNNDFKYVGYFDLPDEILGAGGLGVRAADNVVVEDSAITSNTIGGNGGGALVFDVESLSVTGSTVSGNTAVAVSGEGGTSGADGGGLNAVLADNVVITDSVFDGNTAGYYGGGIEIENLFESLSITGTSITNNSAEHGGGLALDNVSYGAEDGTFTITDVLISGNSAGGEGGDGGGVWMYDVTVPVVMSTSTVRGNQADDDGGGIFVRDSEAEGEVVTLAPAADAAFVLDRSTVSGNLAQGDGGGLAVNYSVVDIVNSTVSGNTANGNGGGVHLYNDSYATIRHSTIVQNSAGGEGGGGGIFVGYSSDAVIDHTIVANNQPDDINGDGNITATFSLIESGPEGLGGEGSTNIIGVDPQLGPLQNNGGPTETHLPLTGSPVIDAGDPDIEDPPETDQRGADRVVDVIDIGAVEVGAFVGGGGGGTPPAATVQFATDTVSVNESAGTATITITRSSSAGTATVRVQSAPGTATSPADFVAVDTTVTFADGETSKTVTVTIVDDFVSESAESFTLALSSPTGASLGATQSAAVTITDDADVCSAGATHPFTDVSPSNVHNFSIACAFELDLTEGTSATTYSPDQPVSRAQMATFIANVLEKVGVALPQTPPDAFDDDNGIEHELAINQLAALGIIEGKGGRTYDPSGNVSRGQMAKFLVGAFEAATGTDATPQSDHFGDDNGDTFENDINTGFELGLFVGTSSTTYSPGVDVRRDQMATFLVRLVDSLAEAGKPQVA